MTKGDIVRVQPTRFQPTQDKSGRRLRLPAWWQWIVGAVTVFVAIVAWFLLTATAVRFESNAESADYEVQDGFSVPSGPSFLMRPGRFTLSANAPGYQSLVKTFDVENVPDQTIDVFLKPLPGRITFEGNPENAEIRRGSEILGRAPLTLKLPSGEISLNISADSYQAAALTETVVGRDLEQTITYQLRPNWAEVFLPTTPSSASVSIDDEPTRFVTPGPIHVPAGERKLSVKYVGHEKWEDYIYVEAEETVELAPVSLRLVTGGLRFTTNPPEASVSIDGQFSGLTPLEVDLRPNRSHRIEATLFGYQKAVRNISLKTGEIRNLHVDFQEITGTLQVTTDPEQVEIWVDDELTDLSNATISLHATEHLIELRKDGYAGYSTALTIQPDFQQELKVRLLTLEEARLEALKQVRVTSEGHELVLMEPTPILMGASRRQPGRRSNEVFRTVNLSRLFYIGKHEVNNHQFLAFASGHDSGSFENVSMNKNEQPVVNVSWLEVARYCNWLSEKEDFEPFYVIRPGDPVTYNENSLGYRLPTEAEWAWVARYQGDGKDLLHFPWGKTLPPPNFHGNYADRAVQHFIGRVIFNYNDNHIVAAPIETYDANYNGVHDMGGNVAEWVHNFYEIPTVDSTVSNLGPIEGEYHVIRGSSWMHGTITDLRLSFRDYGTDGRKDLGFRLARFAE